MYCHALLTTEPRQTVKEGFCYVALALPFKQELLHSSMLGSPAAGLSRTVLEDEATSPPSLLDNESVSEQSDRGSHIETKMAVGLLRVRAFDGTIQQRFEERISRTPMKTHVKSC